jgi:hypothetical protein
MARANKTTTAGNGERGHSPLFLPGLRGKEEEERQRREAFEPEPQPEREDKRPLILLSTDEYRVTREVLAAVQADPAVYQRGGVLVHVVPNAKPPLQSMRGPEAPRLEVLPQSLLRERITMRVRFFEMTDRGPVPAHPPTWCVQAMYQRGFWQGVRTIEGVVQHPVLRPDGTILQEPGYDPKTGLYLAMEGLELDVPEQPTKDEAEDARDQLLEVVADFPFERECHKASWFASLLTPIARYAFPGPAPLFLIVGNAAGVGKGLLLNCNASILLGDRFATATFTSDNSEFRKEITALALSGSPYIVLDNVTGSLGGSALDAALTSTKWDGRILGVSRRYKGSFLVTWYATGNNLVIVGDTHRRVCPTALETPLEKPEERSDFRHPDLLAWVKESRARLLGAALTVLRGYCVAGRPKKKLPGWGSYEGWSDLVRQAVVWVGLEDPGNARVLLRDRGADDTKTLALLLDCWQQLDPERQGLTAARVVEVLTAEDDALAPAGTKELRREMRAAVETLCSGKCDPHALGILLRSKSRTIVDGKFFGQVPGKRNVARWAVYPVSEFSKPPDTEV